MTIKQLIYIVAVADSAFNISNAAEKLFTSQPSISKQIRLLENSLGQDVFVRNGKSLQGLTDYGNKVVAQARIVIDEYNKFIELGNRSDASEQSRFRIATTATQSAFVLPGVLQSFHRLYPDINLDLKDGDFEQLSMIAQKREADCIIISGLQEDLPHEAFPNMVFIPCYEWYQILVCLRDNPLVELPLLSLEDIAKQAIITYPPSKNHVGALESAFNDKGLSPSIFTTSSDPNTIKNYAASGMGVGVLAPMAFDAELDNKLVAISLQDLIPRNITIIAVERHNLTKPHIYRFIRLFAPHLSNADIENIANAEGASGNYAQLPKQDGGNWVI